VAGSYEHDNEPSGFVKCWETLESEQEVASRQGLSSMELVCGKKEKYIEKFGQET
jgi:hypothetical protein